MPSKTDNSNIYINSVCVSNNLYNECINNNWTSDNSKWKGEIIIHKEIRAGLYERAFVFKEDIKFKDFGNKVEHITKELGELSDFWVHIRFLENHGLLRENLKERMIYQNPKIFSGSGRAPLVREDFNRFYMTAGWKKCNCFDEAQPDEITVAEQEVWKDMSSDPRGKNFKKYLINIHILIISICLEIEKMPDSASVDTLADRLEEIVQVILGWWDGYFFLYHTAASEKNDQKIEKLYQHFYGFFGNYQSSFQSKDDLKTFLNDAKKVCQHLEEL